MSRFGARTVWALWSLAAWWRGVYQPWWVLAPCRWPDCLTQTQVDQACAGILSGDGGVELLAAFRARCGCVEED